MVVNNVAQEDEEEFKDMEEGEINEDNRHWALDPPRPDVLKEMVGASQRHTHSLKYPIVSVVEEITRGIAHHMTQNIVWDDESTNHESEITRKKFGRPPKTLV